MTDGDKVQYQAKIFRKMDIKLTNFKIYKSEKTGIIPAIEVMYMPKLKMIDRSLLGEKVDDRRRQSPISGKNCQNHTYKIDNFQNFKLWKKKTSSLLYR